jgi:tetratricopeptide (TPR) repeat protein
MFLAAVGALIYFVVEVVPDFDLLRGMFQRRARRRRIDDLRRIVQENSRSETSRSWPICRSTKGSSRRRGAVRQGAGVVAGDLVDPYYRRGLSALGLGDAAAAVRDLERVVASEPKYDIYRAAGLLAHAYALAGRAEQAEAQFKAATDLSTLSETYYNYAAFCCRNSGRPKRASGRRRFSPRKPRCRDSRAGANAHGSRGARAAEKIAMPDRCSATGGTV